MQLLLWSILKWIFLIVVQWRHEGRAWWWPKGWWQGRGEEGRTQVIWKKNLSIWQKVKTQDAVAVSWEGCWWLWRGEEERQERQVCSLLTSQIDPPYQQLDLQISFLHHKFVKHISPKFPPPQSKSASSRVVGQTIYSWVSQKIMTPGNKFYIVSWKLFKWKKFLNWEIFFVFLPLKGI